MFVLLLAVASLVAEGRPPPPSPVDRVHPPVLYAWGPAVEGRCQRRTWTKAGGWRSVGDMPHLCPAQEAVSISRHILRWTGEVLSIERSGQFVMLPLPTAVQPPIEIGFEFRTWGWFATVQDRQTTWGLPKELLNPLREVDPGAWVKRGDQPNLRENWERRDLGSQSQHLTRSPQLALERVAESWHLQSRDLDGLPSGSWRAHAPPRPSATRTTLSRREPATPQNRAVVAESCGDEETCTWKAPLFVVVGDVARRVAGPQGPLVVSQREDWLAVVDPQGLWLVNASTGEASLTDGVEMVWWTR